MNRRAFLATTAAGAAVAAFPAILKAQGGDTIKVGFPGPTTGPFGALAKDQQQGASVAMEEINAKGGILGRRLEILFRDDQLKPAVGAQRTKELIENERCEFIVGGLAAHVQMAINEQTKKAGKLFISVSQSDEITAGPTGARSRSTRRSTRPSPVARSATGWPRTSARSGGSSTPTTRGGSRTTPSSPRCSSGRGASCSARRRIHSATRSSPRTCRRSWPRSPR